MTSSTATTRYDKRSHCQRTAIPTIVAGVTALWAVTAPIASADPIVETKIVTADDGFVPLPLHPTVRDSGFVFAQTTTYNGTDPGLVRLSPPSGGDYQVRFEESDLGTHATETIDVLGISAAIPSINMEVGSFQMSQTQTSTSETLSVEADTYVQYNNTSNYGTAAALFTKLSGGGTGSTTRKAMIRFPAPTGRVSNATLHLDVSSYNNTTDPSADFYVWGIKDGTDAEAFAEYSVIHSTYPELFDGSIDGTTNSTDALYDGDGDSGNGAQSLGLVTVNATDLSGTVSFTSQAFIDFLNSDSNGVVSIVITRVTNDGGFNSSFASREHSSLTGPRIDVTYEPNNIHTLSFLNTYAHPVVFVQPATRNGTQPIAVYPVYVSDDEAGIRMAEGPDYDGVHSTETIHYLVIEAGFHPLPDGRFIDVGMNTVATTSYDGNGFMPMAPRGGLFDQNSIVIAQPQDSSQSDYQGSRVRKILSGGDLVGFDMRYMLDRDREYGTGTAATAGWMGWMVVGTASPYGAPEDMETWTYDGGVGMNPNAAMGNNTTGSQCGSGSYGNALFSVDDDFGSDTFGAAYGFQAGVTDEGSTASDYVWAGAKGDALVTVFGDDITVIDVGAEATRENNAQNNHAWFTIFEETAIDQDLSVDLSWDGPNWAIFTAKSTFYGVTVKAEIIGQLGMDASGSLGVSGITLNATPAATLTGEASASIGGWCLSASINGDVTLFEVSLPSYFTLDFMGGDISWSASSSLDYASLSGSLYLKIKYCVSSKTKTIFEWTGLSDSIELMNTSGCI